MSDAYQTPLLDLLRSVPKDARDLYSHGGPFETRSIPYGRHCHDAADEISRLRESIAELLALLRDAEDRPLITESPDWWVRVSAAVERAKNSK